MTEYSTTPLALLIGLDGSERVIAVPFPPKSEYLVPVPVKYSVQVDEWAPMPVRANHRVFRLSNMRTSSHRWWGVYNEGRSQTPEDGYVYLEVKG